MLTCSPLWLDLLCRMQTTANTIARAKTTQMGIPAASATSQEWNWLIKKECKVRHKQWHPLLHVTEAEQLACDWKYSYVSRVWKLAGVENMPGITDRKTLALHQSLQHMQYSQPASSECHIFLWVWATPQSSGRQKVQRRSLYHCCRNQLLQDSYRFWKPFLSRTAWCVTRIQRWNIRGHVLFTNCYHGSEKLASEFTLVCQSTGCTSLYRSSLCSDLI